MWRLALGLGTYLVLLSPLSLINPQSTSELFWYIVKHPEKLDANKKFVVLETALGSFKSAAELYFPDSFCEESADGTMEKSFESAAAAISLAMCPSWLNFLRFNPLVTSSTKTHRTSIWTYQRRKLH